MASSTDDHGTSAIPGMRPARCVLVDDHEVVREGTRAVLANAEWITVEGDAGTAGDGLELIRTLRPDVAVLDMRLPDGDGIELARQVQLDHLPTRVVLYTAEASTHQAEQALENGASAFVLKGAAMSTLFDALRSALAGRRYLDPGIAADLMSPRENGPPLSRRERQILQMMAEGGQNAGIALELGIATETVKAHVSNLLAKLGVDSRTEAVATGLRSGIIS